MPRRHGERREGTTIVQKKDANHRKFIHILFHVAKTSISALLSNDVCLSDVDIDTENQKKNGNDISFQQAFQNQK